MKKGYLFVVAVGAIGFGILVFLRFSDEPDSQVPTPPVAQVERPFSDDTPKVSAPGAQVVLPVLDYGSRRTYKAFGEYIEDRFVGYHVGDDIEYADVVSRVPVVAIAPGVIRKIDTVSGYGGVVVVSHNVGEDTVNAIYGHLDIAQGRLREGDTVQAGEEIGVLGEGKSEATDGERKHLHFALYEGEDLRLQGYVKTAEEVRSWMNPTDFFATHGVAVTSQARVYDPVVDLGGEYFLLRFTIPQGMDVEYVPSIQSLNIYSLSGVGTARERSHLFLRYFDASRFLTLSTVTIHSQVATSVGRASYEARQYDIEKKPGVASFPSQPIWRNGRHVVTDVRSGSGHSRYYVLAKNPALSESLYESFLLSVEIL